MRLLGPAPAGVAGAVGRSSRSARVATSRSTLSALDRLDNVTRVGARRARPARAPRRRATVRSSALDTARPRTVRRGAVDLAARRRQFATATTGRPVDSTPVAASRAPDFGQTGDRSRRARAAPHRLNADTSSQPEGLTRRVMLNILEAFFRRPSSTCSRSS